MNALLQKTDIAGSVKVTLFSANDMKKPQKTFQFILDISPLDFYYLFYLRTHWYRIPLINCAVILLVTFYHRAKANTLGTSSNYYDLRKLT